MSAPKFTPGPWRVVKRSNQMGVRGLWVATDKSAGGTWAMDSRSNISGHTEEHIANAHLIAAAPELFEALQSLTANVETAWPSLAELGPLKDARAALAKARGEQ